MSLRPRSPSSLRAAVGVHLALDEAAEGRDPSKSHSRVSTARAAGVDALKGAVARARPRAASELLCRVSSQLAPRDSPTATFSEAPVATAAASELVLGPKDAHGHGRHPHDQQRPSTWPWPQPRKRKLSVAQKSPAERSLPNGSPSSPFWTTFSLRTIDIIVIRRRRPFNAALSLPRGESTAPGSRPDAHSGRGGAQTPGRRPGPRTEARVHPICGISSTRHV